MERRPPSFTLFPYTTPSDLGVGDPFPVGRDLRFGDAMHFDRSEEHTSELQSRRDLVCRLLLEKKNKRIESLIPAIEACTIFILSQSPMLGFNMQIDNLIFLF